MAYHFSESIRKRIGIYSTPIINSTTYSETSINQTPKSNLDKFNNPGVNVTKVITGNVRFI